MNQLCYIESCRASLVNAAILSAANILEGNANV